MQSCSPGLDLYDQTTSRQIIGIIFILLCLSMSHRVCRQYVAKTGTAGGDLPVIEKNNIVMYNGFGDNVNE